MKIKSILGLCLSALLSVILIACDQDKSSFGEDLQTEIIPTKLTYTDIVNAREHAYIQTSTPFINSNGHPVSFEVVHVKKDNQILDAAYLEKVSIENAEVYEEIHEATGLKIVTVDMSTAGRVTIDKDNMYTYGDYYFTIKTTVSVNGELKSTTFDDALHLNIGPGLAQGISYCPNKVNYVNGGNAASEAPQLIGANPNIKFMFNTESDITINEKLLIDENTGVITLNPTYTINAREDIQPVIDVVSTISEEVSTFEGAFTAILTPAPIVIEPETIYFFYPQLKPSNSKKAILGGPDYSVDVVSGNFAGWVYDNNLYKASAGGRILSHPDALASRAAAGVSVVGLQENFWGPLVDPFETWMIADPVNIAQYNGCFDTKMVFWARLQITANIDAVPDGSTPVGFEAYVTDNYTGDAAATNWTQINDLLTYQIVDGDGNLGAPMDKAPYPWTGLPSANEAENAMFKWVRCELDVAELSEFGSVSVGFRTITHYPAPLPSNLRGDLNISDLYFVAKEK